ncbi:hypothetical protein [Candidiatus Paracoxiella cheracis]|uniref:hypothetical protein n=1 Tax=Candidiatus Paracoxiella cheracis TaxID=3405120 RepID=UPI003BF4BCDD
MSEVFTDENNSESFPIIKIEISSFSFDGPTDPNKMELLFNLPRSYKPQAIESFKKEILKGDKFSVEKEPYHIKISGDLEGLSTCLKCLSQNHKISSELAGQVEDYLNSIRSYLGPQESKDADTGRSIAKRLLPNGQDSSAAEYDPNYNTIQNDKQTKKKDKDVKDLSQYIDPEESIAFNTTDTAPNIPFSQEQETDPYLTGVWTVPGTLNSSGVIFPHFTGHIFFRFYAAHSSATGVL